MIRPARVRRLPSALTGGGAARAHREEATYKEHHMANNTQQSIAKSISAGDNGLVTADMLVSYLQSYQPLASGTLDLDVTSVNIRCNGKNVISTDSSGNVTVGSTTGTNIKGRSVQINGSASVGIYAPSVRAEGGNYLALISGDRLYTNAVDSDIHSSQLGLHGGNGISMAAQSISATSYRSPLSLYSGSAVNLEASSIGMHTWSSIGLYCEGDFMLSTRGRLQVESGERMRIQSTQLELLGTDSVWLHAHNSQVNIDAGDAITLQSGRVSTSASQVNCFASGAYDVSSDYMSIGASQLYLWGGHDMYLGGRDMTIHSNQGIKIDGGGLNAEVSGLSLYSEGDAQLIGSHNLWLNGRVGVDLESPRMNVSGRRVLSLSSDTIEQNAARVDIKATQIAIGGTFDDRASQITLYADNIDELARYSFNLQSENYISITPSQLSIYAGDGISMETGQTMKLRAGKIVMEATEISQYR